MLRQALAIGSAFATFGTGIYAYETGVRQSGENITLRGERVGQLVNRINNGLEGVKQLQYVAETGMFKVMAVDMETPEPYPDLVVNGKTLGRRLPFGFRLPPHASVRTLEEIRRNSRPLTEAEVAEAVRVSGLAPDQAGAIRSELVAVDAHMTSDEIPYAADAKEFQKYKDLCDALTLGSQESIPTSTRDVQITYIEFEREDAVLQRLIKENINGLGINTAAIKKAQAAARPAYYGSAQE